MSISPQEFQEFSEYGLARLASGESALSLDDLVLEWDARQNRGSIAAAIEEGIRDAREGRIRPANAAIAELRAKHGLS